MKLQLVTTALLASLIMTTVNGAMRCKLRYEKRAYMDWYDFGANIIYGMYDSPASTYQKCNRCDNFGNKLAELHYSVIDLEDQRQFWLNKENITGLRIFEMLTRLLEVYPLFSDFFTVLQDLFSDPVLFALANGAAPGTPSEIIVLEKRQNSTSYLALYTLLDTIPNSDCAAFGYKLGVLAKMGLGKTVPMEI